MAQSYGNLSISTITAATDEIMGVSSVSQQLGTTLSGADPAENLVAAQDLSINIDQDGAQTITLSAHTNLQDIASDIQEQVRALTVIGFADQLAYDDFTCRWDENLKRLVLTSGTSVTQPPLYAQIPAVVIAGGTAAPELKLGLAEGGSEAYTGSEVITWTVKYRFVYGSGRAFGSADVVVNGSDMTDATDTAELLLIANARASQIKQENELTIYTSGDAPSLVGPVVL